MATVMLVSMIGLWAIGYTLNDAFFGLVLTLGLLVDGAIVIGESIDANRGTDPAEGGAGLGIVQAIDGLAPRRSPARCRRSRCSRRWPSSPASSANSSDRFPSP